jgi:hypothetical protein
MSRPQIENAIRLVLAALVLTVAVAPPALRHAHDLEEGAASHHRHDANHHALDGHVHHSHDGKHHRNDSQPSGASLSSGPWSHLHFHFFGFEFTLPESAPDQGDRESHETEAVSLLSSVPLPVPCGTAQTVLAWLAFPPLTVLPGDAALLQVVVASPPPVSSPPLCDRARRERSGVLIA